MSVTDLALPDDVAVLDATDDPGAFVIAALDRAKAWLAQATVTTLPEVVDAKAKAGCCPWWRQLRAVQGGGSRPPAGS